MRCLVPFGQLTPNSFSAALKVKEMVEGPVSHSRWGEPTQQWVSEKKNDLKDKKMWPMSGPLLWVKRGNQGKNGSVHEVVEPHLGAGRHPRERVVWENSKCRPCQQQQRRTEFPQRTCGSREACSEVTSSQVMLKPSPAPRPNTPSAWWGGAGESGSWHS